MIYICEGADKEKLDWFKIINIAGVQLANQELRNAIYTGPWLTDAKRYFSKNNCPAQNTSSNYLKGSSIRQDYLETAIRWISAINGEEIEDYMSTHQHELNANELWLYFQSVINWVKIIFPKYRSEMKGIEWGLYYNNYKDNQYDANKLERKILELIDDDDITNTSGIYEYLLDGQEKHLNLRKFKDKEKRKAYERQKGICVKCDNLFEFNEMEGDQYISLAISLALWR